MPRVIRVFAEHTQCCFCQHWSFGSTFVPTILLLAERIVEIWKKNMSQLSRTSCLFEPPQINAHLDVSRGATLYMAKSCSESSPPFIFVYANSEGSEESAHGTCADSQEPSLLHHAICFKTSYAGLFFKLLFYLWFLMR